MGLAFDQITSDTSKLLTQKHSKSTPEVSVQTKLEIGEPDSEMEREADDVADMVMEMPESAPPMNPLDDDDDEDELRMKRLPQTRKVQLKTSHAKSTNSISAPQSVEKTLSNSHAQGHSLDESVNEEMSAKMGADFSDVKIHTDSNAIQMNKDLGARAFTLGNNIYFNERQYSPSSSEGKHLLAHELTHVVHQDGESNKSIQRAIIEGEPFEDGLIPLISNATTISGFAADGITFNSRLRRGYIRNIMVFSQYGLHVYDLSGRRINHFRKREGEPTLADGIWGLGSDGSLGRFGKRGDSIKIESRSSSSEVFSEERQRIIEAREDDVILFPDDYAHVTYSELNAENYLPALIVFGQVTVQEGNESEGGDGESGAPDWAWSKYREVKSRIDAMRAGGASERRLPGDLVLLRSEGSEGRINVWLLPENEEGSHEGPRRRITFTQETSTENLLELIFDTTEQLARSGANESSGGGDGEAGEEVTEVRFSAEFGEPGEEGEGYEYPPLPASLSGQKLQPTGGTGVFAMDIDYNYAAPDLLGQVAWAFQHTYYRWELWNITETEAVQQRAEEIRTGGLAGDGGDGSEVDRLDHVSGDFERRIEQLEQRPDQIRADRQEALREGRYMDVIANELNEDLIGLEATMALGSELLGAAADLFSDDQERSIYWNSPGVYVVRCIGVINPGAEPDEPRRAPSVATMVVSVRDVDELSREAIDAPKAQLEELRLQLLLWQNLPEDDPQRSEIETLEQQIAQMELVVEGSVIELIQDRLNRKEQELEQAREQSIFLEHGLSDSRVSRLEREVEELRDQLSLARTRDSQLGVLSDSRQVHRAHGVLVSNVTGQTYPLLLQVSEPVMEDDQWKCYLSDVTSRDAERYEGFTSTDGPVAEGKLRAVEEAFERFAGAAGYGEGSLTIRLPDEGWYASIPEDRREFTIESRPRDWTAARQRLEELGQVIAVLGLVVTSPALGIAGGVLSAALAGDRIARRLQNDTFRWDSQAVGDMIDIVSAGVSIANFGAIGALQRIPDEGGGFILRAARGTAQATGRVTDVADEVLDVAGVIHCNAETAENLARINAAVADGSMTRTEARAQRASIISGAIQSNGLSFASRVRGAMDDGGSSRRSRAPDDAPVRTGQPSGRHEQLVKAMGDFAGQVPVRHKSELGNGVQVRYDEGRLVLEVGPDAEPRHIQYHHETIRQLQRYEGVVGMIRQLTSRIRQLLGLEPGYGSRGFEARLEVDKLRRILSELETLKQQIQERAENLSQSEEGALARTESEQAAIQREIDGITDQLQYHMRDVDSAEAGTGVVASGDTTGADQHSVLVDRLRRTLDNPDLPEPVAQQVRELLRQAEDLHESVNMGEGGLESTRSDQELSDLNRQLDEIARDHPELIADISDGSSVAPLDNDMIQRFRDRIDVLTRLPGNSRLGARVRESFDDILGRQDLSDADKRMMIQGLIETLMYQRAPTRSREMAEVDMNDPHVREAFERALADPELEGNPHWQAYVELVQQQYYGLSTLFVGPSPRSTDSSAVPDTNRMRADFYAGMQDGSVTPEASTAVTRHLERAVEIHGSEAAAVAAGEAVWIDPENGARADGSAGNVLWPADPVWGVWRVDHIVEIQHGGTNQPHNYYPVPQRMHAIKSIAMNIFGYYASQTDVQLTE